MNWGGGHKHSDNIRNLTWSFKNLLPSLEGLFSLRDDLSISDVRLRSILHMSLLYFLHCLNRQLFVRWQGHWCVLLSQGLRCLWDSSAYHSILQYSFSCLRFINSLSNTSECYPSTFSPSSGACGKHIHPSIQDNRLFPTSYTYWNIFATSSLTTSGAVTPIGSRFPLFITNGILQKDEDFSLQWINKILSFHVSFTIFISSDFDPQIHLFWFRSTLPIISKWNLFSFNVQVLLSYHLLEIQLTNRKTLWVEICHLFKNKICILE